MIGYHFTGATLRDNRPIPAIGEWLVYEGPIVLCKSGLYASEHPFDALQYAHGEMLHLVELEGDLVVCGDTEDKTVGRRRKIIASFDATAMCWEFSRWCALRVIDTWDAPTVVRDYLTTGDESLRVAAEAAVGATEAAFGAAFWSAGAAGAARAAAWSAWSARAAVGAARLAAWAAALAAAWDASRVVEWDASRVVEWAAERAVAWAAAWDASRAVQRAQFATMVDAELDRLRRKESGNAKG